MSTTTVTDLLPIGSVWGPPTGYDWQDKNGPIHRSVVIGYDDEMGRVVLREALRTYVEGFGTRQERTIIDAEPPLVVYFGVKYDEVERWVAEHQRAT